MSTEISFRDRDFTLDWTQTRYVERHFRPGESLVGRNSKTSTKAARAGVVRCTGKFCSNKSRARAAERCGEELAWCRRSPGIPTRPPKWRPTSQSQWPGKRFAPDGAGTA